MGEPVKKKLNKRQLRDMWDALEAIAGKELPTKFVHAAARNRATLRPIHDALVEAGEPIKEFQEKHRELAIDVAIKDAEGNPVVLPGNQGYAVGDMQDYKFKLEKLKAETGQDKKDQEIADLLKDEEEVGIYLVHEKYLPEAMRTDVLEGLLPMITDEDPAALALHAVKD